MKMSRIPKFPYWLLRKLTPFTIHEGYAGDIEEEFEERVQTEGKRKAIAWIWFHAAAAIPKAFRSYLLWGGNMFKNFMKIAYRNMIKYKGHSAINIAGLTVGMACYILIMLYVQYELSYDDFHEKAQRVFRVQKERSTGHTSVITFGPLASALVSEYPEVVQAVRIEHRDEYEVAIRYGSKSFYERGFYVDDNFFDMFSYDIIQGDTKTALTEPFSMVITEKLAEKYFGKEEPMGKTLTVIDAKHYDAKITGVIKDVPPNSHLQFDFLASMVTLRKIYDNENFGGTWHGSDFLTYVELKEKTDSEVLEEKFPAFIQKHQNRQDNSYYLIPVRDIHLKSQDNFEILKNKDLQNIHFLSLVAYLILIIACINYLNLATAKVLKRSKEIGIRKVIGAYRKQLILQFLYESLLLSAIALVLAILLTTAALPTFNSLANREISFHLFRSLTLLPELIGLVVIVGLLSGIYPAVYITSFKPVKALSGKYTLLSTRSRLRNTFVAFQFCVSIGLIAGTLIVVRQLHYIKTKDMGYDREHVLAMPIREDVIRDNLESLKTELLNNPSIQAVSASSHIPNRITWGGSLNSKDNEVIRTNSCAVDFDYVDLFDIDIVKGRNFSRDFVSDRNGAFLLSETAVQSLGWESPLGMECTHWDLKTGQVVGIFRDFHFRSLHQTVRPLYLILDPSRVRVLFVKIQPDDILSVIKFVGKTIASFHPSHPFQYFFLDDSFNDMYKSEQQFGKIIIIFASLAIFIACLGLLGLVSFSAEIRTKEIGIRKVLGASASQVMNQITKEYLFLIVIAALVASPVAYLLLNKWLLNFAYRVHLGWDAFLISGLTVVSVAYLTVSYNAIKAARANPVESLRYE